MGMPEGSPWRELCVCMCQERDGEIPGRVPPRECQRARPRENCVCVCAKKEMEKYQDGFHHGNDRVLTLEIIVCVYVGEKGDWYVFRNRR